VCQKARDTSRQSSSLLAYTFICATVAAMRSLLSGTLALLAVLNSVSAWGGLFNRFSPEMLSNLGYGGHGCYRAQPFLQVSIV
jgi:hypothetical protein